MIIRRVNGILRTRWHNKSMRFAYHPLRKGITPHPRYALVSIKICIFHFLSPVMILFIKLIKMIEKNTHSIASKTIVDNIDNPINEIFLIIGIIQGKMSIIW